MFTESSWVSLARQQAACDCVFHQLDQTQHHLWYSSWHWSRHPNAYNNTAISAYDSVFHQLDQTQHHLWYSSWQWSRHPNSCNNIATSAYCTCMLIYHILVQRLISLCNFHSTALNRHNMYKQHALHNSIIRQNSDRHNS